MPRPRSQTVRDLKERLIVRIREGFYRPGERFLSNRALSVRFGVSYQTAHRLIAELSAEGWLKRRAASGTYIPGSRTSLRGVQLRFHPRAKRPGSFGARLLEQLTLRLDMEKIPWQAAWQTSPTGWPSKWFPVLWERSEALKDMPSSPENYALLLNDIPPPGLMASRIDSVSTDDFSGGVTAAEVVLRKCSKKSRIVILAGPAEDLRNRNRIAGFRSIFPKCGIIWAGGWDFQDGLKAGNFFLQKMPDAIFCCNDRLAEAVIHFQIRQKVSLPLVVGFDDAPVAEKLNLTTISIPWDELVDGAIGIIKKRLRGDSSIASRQIYSPRPVLRGFHF